MSHIASLITMKIRIFQKMTAILPVIALVAISALTLAPQANAAEGWETDLAKAKATAKASGKMLLIDFTGSDWCPPCMALNKRVLSQKEFIDEASKKFVLVELDFPKKKKLPEAQAAANEAASQTYNIEYFPTIVLTDADGKEFARLNSGDFPDIAASLKTLNTKLEDKDML